MPLTLTIRERCKIPIEVEGITPESLRGLPLAGIERRSVLLGNRELPLAELFHVRGNAAGRRLTWEGDLSGVHWIGAKMTAGEIHVEGSAGRHLGSDMRGGEIHVAGDAGDWAGGEMHGGLIHVRGRAGHLVGAAYRGSRRGMTGGAILIEGDAGNEIGHTMRRGLIAVAGDIGDLAGFNILAGTLLFFGGCGIRHGAGMRRGTIAFLGEAPPLLPTFRAACRSEPDVMRLLAAELRQRRFAAAERLPAGELELFHGDLLEGGRGEIFLRAA